ncbi:MAG: hypothetical protein R3A51_03255 [Nannocystaceae bacterium]|nr:hypothetical protein [Myxococcales bacterium]
MEPTTSAAPGDDAQSDGGAAVAPDDGARATFKPDRDAALQAFDEASAHYHAGRYRDAGFAFLRSFEAAPSIETLWAAANSFRLAGEVILAVTTYERYFQYVDDNERRVESSRKFYEALRDRVGSLTVHLGDGVSVSEIRVNGNRVALADFPVMLLAGPVTVEFVGGEPGQRRVNNTQVTGRVTTLVTFDGFGPPAPAQVGGPPKGTTDQATPWRPPPLVRPFFWTSLAVTTASGVALVVMGALTLREKAAFEDMNAAGAAYPADREANFFSFRQVTNVLVGVTAGLGVITIALGVVSFSNPRKRARSTQARVSLATGGLRLRF